MTTDREKGLAVAKTMVGDAVAGAMEASLGSTKFGAYRGEMAVDFVFGKLWSRDQLDRRSRSLVTLGILIALGQTGELRIHLMAAIRNGCTVSEVEEAIYHAAAYAGFPLSNQAAHIAEEVFRKEGLID
ncbi:MAG: carboxymuconolactone decarboxylase family protein [Porticoccaceae bacterium]|jgi:4-carboxymuconolactone decarboxylase|nr:carboxymuconolactone decarboxylase family protein [Porticoccaceae bacterium]HLS97903.1 carboxymuconolactone decarboxylase family protein [Porticoccaceae bacterium]